jgi:hypothetical protein
MRAFMAANSFAISVEFAGSSAAETDAGVDCAGIDCACAHRSCVITNNAMTSKENKNCAQFGGEAGFAERKVFIYGSTTHDTGWAVKIG